jgi:putative FmdB family regulatory protein
MPTYEYLCDGCGHRFDEFQSFKDEALRMCPECEQDKLRRLFGTGSAILFKGSGFYETDYRSESYKKAAKADQETSSGTNGSAGGDGAKPSPTKETAKGEAKPSTPSN